MLFTMAVVLDDIHQRKSTDGTIIYDGANIAMDENSDKSSVFTEELRSIIKNSLPILRYAFAVELGLLTLSLIVLLLLDGETASYYVVQLNIAILLIVLFPTAVVLYVFDAPDENQRDMVS